MLVAVISLVVTIVQPCLALSLYKDIYSQIEHNSIINQAIQNTYPNHGYIAKHRNWLYPTPIWYDFDLDDIFNQIHDGIKGIYGEDIPPILHQLLQNLHNIIGRSADTVQKRSREKPEQTDYSLEDIFNEINDIIKGYTTTEMLFLGKRDYGRNSYESNMPTNK